MAEFRDGHALYCYVAKLSFSSFAHRPHALSAQPANKGQRLDVRPSCGETVSCIGASNSAWGCFWHSDRLIGPLASVLTKQPCSMASNTT